MQTLEPVTRPLSPGEKRLLKARLRSIDDDIRRAARVFFPGVVIILILWALTLAASDASWIIVTGFWIIVGGMILVWVGRDMRKHTQVLSEMKEGLESALEHDKALVYDIKSRAFASFEEFEDEGACYAFEIDGPRVVFMSGQEFYEASKFPSLDFSLVNILDESGREVEMVIDKRGPRATPEYVIPAQSKFDLGIPDHLEVRTGTLAEAVESYTPKRI